METNDQPTPPENDRDATNDLTQAKNLIAQAKQVFIDGDNELARDLYIAAMNTAPDEAVTHAEYGYFLYQTQYFEDAADFMEIACSLDPKNAKYNYRHGRCLMETALKNERDSPPEDIFKTEKYEAALACFVKADRLMPNNEEYLIELGKCHRRLSQTDEAFKCFQRVIALNDKHALAYTLIAECYAKIGKEDQAIPYMKTAIFHDRENAHFHARLAKIYINTNQPENAENALWDAIRQDSTEPKFNMQMALLYRIQDRFDEAMLQIERARKKALISEEYAYRLPDIYNMEQDILDDKREYDSALAIEENEKSEFDLGINSAFDAGHGYSDDEDDDFQGYDDYEPDDDGFQPG